VQVTGRAPGSGERGGDRRRSGTGPRSAGRSPDRADRPKSPPSSERPSRPAGTAPGPELPDEVTGSELDREVRAELSGLGTHGAKQVARHLVMVGRLLDDDPELAWAHAVAARARGARLAVVREAAGLAAYRTGRYAEALSELRTVRRLTGRADHLPVMADCERGLGRPVRALELAASPAARQLGTAERIELQIVVSGARTDLGQLDAAVLAVQLPELQSTSDQPWVGRLRAAYAAALAAVGRQEEADLWARRAGDWSDDWSGDEPDQAEEAMEGLIDVLDVLDDQESE
jgi:hypothetical protein